MGKKLDINKKKLMVAINEPLREQDTENQTYGCRYHRPDFCANHSMPEVCAFVNEDHICRRPSTGWKRKYNELKGDSGEKSKK